MTRTARQPFSFEDYALLEEASSIKHEFLDGQVWATAGGSPEHAAIAASLREVVLVAHDERRIDLWRRVDEHWTQVIVGPEERMTLASIDCELAVADIYFDPLAP